MQLIIKHNTSVNPLILPINYNHILQSIVYDKLSECKQFGDYMHNCGWKNDERNYKLFQFSQIRGHYIVTGKNIVFDDMVSWEIRSIDDKIIRLIRNSIQKYGINYNNLHYSDIVLEVKDLKICSNKLRINMDTPICVYSTNSESKRVTYYTPEENHFYSLVSDNFIRKYNAYTGISISDTIHLELEKYSQRDKVVTKYKGNYISGWKGVYTLSGKKEYMEFLYNVGLGARNSQGFGMFSIL